MTNILSESQRIQYADHSSIYRSYKANGVTKCSSELENVLKLLEQWSKNTQIFNTQNIKAPSTL